MESVTRELETGPVASGIEDWVIKYRPRRYDQMIQGVSKPPMRDLVLQEKQKAYGHINLCTGSFGCGKSAFMRIRSMRRNCINYRDHDYEPCGHCQGCRWAECGGGLLGNAVIWIDFTNKDWKKLIRENAFGWSGRQVLKKDRTVPYLVCCDEFHLLDEMGQMWVKEYMDSPEHTGISWLLATAEPDKVLPCIRSRSEEHRFTPPTAAMLIPWLTNILNAEQVSYQPRVPELIIQMCDRYPRKILKESQRMSRWGEQITAASVREQFGVE
jgi:DNA polymerase III subunit gamma/tau